MEFLNLATQVKITDVSREQLLKAVKSNFSDYEYFKLHSKAVFADLDDPTDKFGSWMNFIKALELKRFDRLFQLQLGQKIEPAHLQILNKYYSNDFLDRVQKSLRVGSSIEVEFPDNDNNSEERICAGYVRQLVEYFNQNYSNLLDSAERKLLAEDNLPSQLKELAKLSTSLVLYDKQKFDFLFSPPRCRSDYAQITIDRHYAS